MRKRLQDTDTQREGQNPVDMAINHLGELCVSMQNCKRDGDAQSIARWIRVLIDQFADEPAGSRIEHPLDVLKSLQDGLLLANRIRVNSKSVSRRTIPTNVTEVNRKSSVVTFGKSELRLDTTTLKSIDTTGQESTESFSVLRLNPTERPSKSGTSVTVFFGERTDYLQGSFLCPTVIAYRTVHHSSKVFELVEQDDADGLIRLFASQEGSPRDCNESDESLLYVSGTATPLNFCVQ